MIQVNILVDNMGHNQLSYCITQLGNKLSDTRPDIDLIVFYNNIAKIASLPKFAMMQMVEAWGQRGITIATSCSTARKMLTFPGAERRLLYVWDLEWLRGQNRHYNMYAPIYQLPHVPLIARSEIHHDAIDNAFNVLDIKPIYLVEDFNEKQFLEVIDCERVDTSNCAA